MNFSFATQLIVGVCGYRQDLWKGKTEELREAAFRVPSSDVSCQQKVLSTEQLSTMRDPEKMQREKVTKFEDDNVF